MPGSVQCSYLGLEPEAAAAQEEESWLRLIRHPPRLGGIFSPQRRRNGDAVPRCISRNSVSGPLRRAIASRRFASRRTCSN